MPIGLNTQLVFNSIGAHLQAKTVEAVTYIWIVFSENLLVNSF